MSDKDWGYNPTMFQRRSNIHPKAQIDYDLKWLGLICVVGFVATTLFAVNFL